MADIIDTGVTFGIAFLPKKLPRVLNRELQRLAENVGLRLVALDPYAPLEGQEKRKEEAAADSDGPCTAAFDVITHKLHADPEWEANLSRYLSIRPHVRLLDSPTAIHVTEDRALMLSAIPPAGLELQLQLGPWLGPQPPSEATASAAAATRLPGSETGVSRCMAELVAVRVLSPPQAVVGSREELLALAEGGGRQGLQPPLIIKTRRTDAPGGSGHGLAVALTWKELAGRAEALQGAACVGAGPAGGGSGSSGGGGWVPLIVQQYVPHSEALYKVYVLGRQIRVVRRASLTLQQLRAMAPAAPSSPPPPKRPKQQPELQQQQQHQQLGEEGEEEVAQPRRLQHAAQPEGASSAAHGSPQASGGLMLQNLSARPQPTAGNTGEGTGAGTGTGSNPTGTSPAGVVRVADGSDAGGQRSNLDAMSGLMARSTAAPAPASGGAEGEPPGAAAAAASVRRAMLDERLLGAVARELSRRMALTLFNFDVVVPELGSPADGPVPCSPEVARAGPADVEEGGPAGPGQRAGAGGAAGEVLLYVVDVNYFPGYDKLAGWEAMLVEHLRAVADEVVAARGGGGRDTA